METGFVLVSVLVALLAIWGAIMLWRATFEWWFAPQQLRRAVVIGRIEDIENLDFLLFEAEKNCMCHKDSRTVVILLPDMVSVWNDVIQRANLYDDIPPDQVLHNYGAVLLVGDFLED